MWYVMAVWHETNCFWGAYKDKETADEVAKRVNGSVLHQSDLERMRNESEA